MHIFCDIQNVQTGHMVLSVEASVDIVVMVKTVILSVAGVHWDVNQVGKDLDVNKVSILLL